MNRLLLILVLLTTPAWATFSLVGSKKLANTNSYTSSDTYTCTAGNALLISVGENDNGIVAGDITVSDSENKGAYQKIGQSPHQNDGSNNNQFWLYYRPACNGGTLTITVNADSTSGTTQLDSVVMELGGLAYDHTPSWPIVSFASQNNSGGSSLSTGSISPTGTNFQLAIGYHSYNDVALTVSPSYPGSVSYNATYIFYNTAASSGSASATFTTSSGSNHNMHVAILAFQTETYPTSGFVQSAIGWRYTGTPGTTTAAATTQFAVQTGHMELVAVAQVASSTAPTSVTSSLGNTCSLQFSNTAGADIFIYTCPVTTGGTETITVTPGASVSGLTAEVMEYAGYGTTVNASGNSGSVSTNPVVASLTTTVPTTAVVSWMITGNTTTWPVFVCTSGLTQRAYTSNAGLGLAAYDQYETSTGTYSNSCSSVKSDGSNVGNTYLNYIAAFASSSGLATQIGVFLVGP